MSLPRQDVKDIARLCRLSLSPEEVDEMGVQLSHILDQFNALRLLDTDGVPPTMHVADFQSVLREDVASASLPSGDVLANAPRQQAGQFRVGLVIDE